jgi:hypothetical protein
MNLTGTGAAPEVDLSATTLTFGSQLLGTSTPAQPVTLTNNGNLPLSITSIAVTGADVSDFPETNTCGSSVPAGANCTISVTFAPTATGSLTAAITITDSASGSPQTVSLTGTGSNPLVSLSSNSITFGNQNIGATSAAQSVTLDNTGNASLTIAGIAVTGANPGDFTATNNCGASVAAAGTCTISVTFTPSAAGSRAASVAVTDNASGSPQMISLTGTGVGTAAVAGLSTTSLTFGSQSLGTTSGALPVILTNTGNSTLTTAIAVTGANAGDFGETDDCAGSVATGNSCTISVAFTPTLATAESAALTITDNAANSPQTVSLSGTGTTSQVSLSITTLTLGSLAVGTSAPPQAVTLTNTGNASLTITSIGATGANPGDFAVTNTCGSSVAAGGSCTITVTFTPAALGARTAVLSIADSAAGSPQTVNLSGTGSAPSANLTPTSLNFGSQTLGTISAVQPVTLTNQGNAALTISGIVIAPTGPNPGDFAVTNTCGTSVPAGGNCTISVTFAPTATGTRTASVTITDNSTGSPQTVSLTGMGTGPLVSVSLSTASYSSQSVGTTSGSQTVTMNNTGNSALTITGIQITGANAGAFTETNTCGSSVPAGGTCTITITFTPTGPGTETASLVISDNATTSPQMVNLTGTGSAPIASVSPASLTFSLQNLSTTSAAQTVTLSNTGNAALTISGISFTGANPGDFLETTTCGSSLAASSSCTISVTFSPTASGTRTASLTISDNTNNVAGSLQSVSLTGTGTGPTVSLSPSSLFFGSETEFNTTTLQNITLTNTGSANLSITSIAVTGTDPTDFAQTNTCGNLIQVNATCTISVTFTPQASGGRTAAISLTDNAPGSPQMVALTGTGLSGSISLTPTSMTFASQSVGTVSNAQSVTVSNTGNSTITINSISIVGPNAGDFSQTNGCASSLAVSTSCTIVVKFTPSAFGTRTATVSISDNLQSSPDQASLTGTGSAAAVSLSAGALTFATQNLGQTSAAQTVTLTNTGNANLAITSLGTTGADPSDFAVTNTCGSSVAAGGTCTISVTFTPVAVGTRTASVTIADNAGGSPQTVSLSGSSVGPIAGLSTTSLTFSSQTVATTSAAQTLTLSNTGNAALTINSIAFTGANPGDFAQTSTCGSSLAASSSCTISVTFTPTAVGSRAASLTITDNNNNVAGSTQSVSLSGTSTGATVSLSATNIAFGNQSDGVVSASQSVTLTNTGNVTLTFTSSITVTGTNATDFTQTNTCGTSVAANGTCTISVTFKPSLVGAESAAVTLTDNAPGSPQSLALAGTGTGPVVSLSPTSLTFSSTNVNAQNPTPQTVTVNNTGTGTLTINTVMVTGTNPASYAQTNTCGTPVAAGGNCTITVTFMPAAEGSLPATLTITDNAANSPQMVSLAGTGSAPIASVPPSLTFSTSPAVGTSATQTVTLSNNGNAPLTFTTAPLTGANPGDYSQTNTCAGSVAASSSCALSVTFTPAAPGTRTATLTITDNSNNVANSTQSVSLSGTGTGAAVSLSAPSIAFGSQTEGVASASQTVTLTNTGNATLNFTSSIAVTGTNAADFGQTNTCGSSVLAGNACTITVTFTPSTANAESAAVTLTDNAPGSPPSISLSGTGVTGISLSPSSLTFSSTNVSATSAAQTATLTNTGTASITSISITITGTNSGDYSQTNTCGTSLAVNANCTISVKFVPTAPGTRTASVSIADSLTSSPQTVSLTGTGSAPIASVPASLTFSTAQAVGTSATQTVTLSNNGNAPLTFTTAPLTGANPGDYTQTNTCAGSVAASSSCALSVTFTPAAPGTRTATLTITDNTNNVQGSTQIVTLSGIGNAPIAGAAPTTLTFSSSGQTVGTTSTAQTATLTNTGNVALSISGIGFTGTNPGDFGETNTCGSSLAASGVSSCTISVTFTPTSSGTRTATLTITDNSNNSAGSTQTVNVTGTGNSSNAALSPNTLTFGNQVVLTPSSSQTVTLSNSGNLALTITSITVGGSNAGDFGETNTCGSSVAGGGNCMITVAFTPSASGSRTAVLSIADNATAGSPQAVSLSGVGVTGSVGLSASTLTFGSQSVGTTSTPAQVVTLTNVGTASVTITSVPITGTNASAFAKSADTCTGATIPAATPPSTCMVGVTFTPTTSGSATAGLNFTDSATNSPQPVSLTGTGTAPEAGLSPTSVAFPTNQPAATSSSAETFTLSNTGTAILNIASIGFTGTDPGDFSQNTTCGSTLAASTNCTITVVFTPAASGSRSGSLTVTDNSGNVSGSTQSATLTGTSIHDVILTWTASTSSWVAGYNVYRGTASGAESTTPVNSTIVTGTTYVDTAVTAGTKYYYVVTAVAANGAIESGNSNEASATVPTP